MGLGHLHLGRDGLHHDHLEGLDRERARPTVSHRGFHGEHKRHSSRTPNRHAYNRTQKKTELTLGTLRPSRRL